MSERSSTKPDPWTPEWTAALRELRAGGHSFGAIASALKSRFPETAFSRSAVGAKLHRLGLCLKEEEVSVRCAWGERRMRSKSPRSAPAPKLLPTHKPKLTSPPPPRRSREPALPPDCEPVTIDQLVSRHCRWPIDPDPSAEEPAWRYCGASRDPDHKSYCSFHAERSAAVWPVRRAKRRVA